MNLVILVLLVLALVAALEPQHRHARGHPRPRLGADNALDRDRARVAADLHAAAEREEAATASSQSRRLPGLVNSRRQHRRHTPTVLS